MLAFFAMVVLAMSVGASQASAAEPYGEVARFGGFDASGEHLGKFVLPVGFAVDPSESNAIYVLDRVLSEETEEGGTLQYRLQKLSSTGTPIASVLLPAESYTNENKTGAHPLIGLAVDSTNHRVYTLVQNIISDGSASQAVPVVERLVAWSTKPEGAKLVPASGFKEPDPVTGAALVAGANVLEPAKASEAFYLPQALTVDPSHNVVIEAEGGVKSGPTGGPMVLEQVKIQGAEGEKVGVLGEHFTAETTIAPKSQIGDGLFTTQNGSLGLDMWAEEADISLLATIHASIQSNPEPTLVAKDESKGENRDAAMSIDNEDTIAYPAQFSNGFVLKPYAAGSPITQLTNGLYAARYAETFDSQQGVGFPGNHEPFENTQPFWYQGRQVFQSVAREGVRLFSESGTIATTLGAEKEGEPCYIGFAAVALAAGAGETVFALDQPNSEDENKGDEVVEFAPDANAATQCHTDSRTVAVNGSVTTSVTVAEGAKVSFEARLSNPAADNPYEFVWSFGDGTTETRKMEAAKHYRWPEPTIEHQYPQTPSIYHASVRIYGGFGTSEVPIEVTVSPATPPTAEFTSPGGAAEEVVRFDASKSTAPAGTHIEKYEWNFGDGHEVTTPNATETHRFAKAGAYTVTLKVVDLGKVSEPVSHTVVISEGAQEKTEREAREQSEREAREKAAREQSEREARERAAREAQERTAREAKEKEEALIKREEAGGTTAQLSGGASSTGTVTIVISCPAGYAGCEGQVELRTAAAVAAAGGKGRKAPLTLGKTSFSIVGGSSKKLAVHLSGRALALLRRVHALRTLVLITTSAHGVTHTNRETVTLRLAPKGNKRH